MEDNLSWFDKNLLPRTKAYKNFIKEMENTSSEQFFRDGERVFTNKEKKFMSIHQSKEREVITGSNFTLKTIFNSNQHFPLEDKFNDPAELVRFIEKQRLDYKLLIVQNNREFTETIIDSEAMKHKVLSDLWATELEKKTDLSFGLTNTKIDERQAHHYRNYEIEDRKLLNEKSPAIGDYDDAERKELAEKLNNYYQKIEEPMWDFSKEHGRKVLGFAIDLGNSPKELRDTTIEYISLESPYYPARSDFTDDSYDRGESDYQKAMERYEVEGMKYTNTLQNYKEIFDKYHFDPHIIDDLNFSQYESATLNLLIDDLSENLGTVGKITYCDSGEEMKYYSPESYLIAVRRELDSNPDRFKYETLLRTPELVKGVDDLIYGLYGEENPNSLDSYRDRLKNDTKITSSEIKNISALQNPEDDSTIRISEKIQALHRERNYELLADNFSTAKIIGQQIDDLEKQLKNINNQNPNIMETQKDFDQVQYLKDQLKYLGFGEGEKLHKDLEKAIRSSKTQFEIKTSSDKTLPENKVGFLLRFNKTDSGGVFFNSYQATLNNEKNETIHHKFQVSKENTFTAKEAVNLLEGRAVKIEFDNPKKGEKEEAFVQFDFNKPKTDNGNYYFQNFYQNYGVDTEKIIEKSNLIFDQPEWKQNTMKSLEKGNVVKVKFEQGDKVVEGKAVLDPQNRNLKLYDNDMNRLNTNKPLEGGLEQDNTHEKSNVKEQSIKR